MIFFVFFFVFVFCFFFMSDTCPYVGPLILLFRISGDVFSGFKSQSGQPYLHFGRCIHGIYIYVHPWCNTFTGVYRQHSSQLPSPHVSLIWGSFFLAVLKDKAKNFNSCGFYFSMFYGVNFMWFNRSIKFNPILNSCIDCQNLLIWVKLRLFSFQLEVIGK